MVKAQLEDGTDQSVIPARIRGSSPRKTTFGFIPASAQPVIPDRYRPSNGQNGRSPATVTRFPERVWGQ